MSKKQQATSNKQRTTRNPWTWVPPLYFAEGLPYIIVMTLSVIMYKRLGVSNSDIALYTSWLYLPWVIKPFWSPLVDMLKTKRWWIFIMQLVIGVGLAGVAFTIPVPGFFQYTLAFFFLLAFSSATHDIAADGFYMLALDQGDQSFYVGIRSTFYRLAMLTGQGLFVILAGSIESNTGKEPLYINVKTVDNKEIIQPSIPKPVNSNGADFSGSKSIEINMVPVSSKIADSIVLEVMKLNQKNGFYSTNEQKSLGQSTTSKKTGNIVVGWIRLNEEPADGEEIILNINQYRGNKDISVVEGTRFTFNSSNADKTAYIVFKVDDHLDKNVETVFIGRSGNINLAWSITFGVIAVFFVLLFIYHRFILPRPASDRPFRKAKGSKFLDEFWETFASFFRKERIGVALAFLLLYRLGESQLVKLASPFLLDSTEDGGLGLTTGQLGIYYGTFGIIALSLGGIIGGIVVSKKGLKYWLWWMVLAINLPNLVYVYLSGAMPDSGLIIGLSIVVEQFGYGFGFTAYMMYCIYIAEGKSKTAHFAMATGLMALGMMIPGMISGWLQEIIGYQHFFIWVMLCTIPGFIVVAFLKIDPMFGKKKKED